MRGCVLLSILVYYRYVGLQSPAVRTGEDKDTSCEGSWTRREVTSPLLSSSPRTVRGDTSNTTHYTGLQSFHPISQYV